MNETPDVKVELNKENKEEHNLRKASIYKQQGNKSKRKPLKPVIDIWITLLKN